jgi:hypothetical protein
MRLTLGDIQAEQTLLHIRLAGILIEMVIEDSRENL